MLTKTDKPDAPVVPPCHGHRERLRARFLAGSEALADYELLELVLFGAIPRRDVKPLAKSLLERFGSFAEVISAPPQLLGEAGLGEATITELKVIEAAAPSPQSEGQAPSGAVVVVGTHRLLPRRHGVRR